MNSFCVRPSTETCINKLFMVGGLVNFRQWVKNVRGMKLIPFPVLPVFHLPNYFLTIYFVRSRFILSILQLLCLILFIMRTLEFRNVLAVRHLQIPNFIKASLNAGVNRYTCRLNKKKILLIGGKKR